MRLALKIVFVLLITEAKAQSQKTSCTDITKTEIEKKEKLSDFGSTPSGCTVVAGEFSYKMNNGKAVRSKVEGDATSKEFIRIFSNSPPGSKIYLDIVYRCGSQTRHGEYCYKIITK